MSTTSKKFTLGDNTLISSDFGGWLEKLDHSIDWTSFDRYFLWLQKPTIAFRHQPLQLFKSLLVRNWFSLSALEFNHEISDRLSFRRFVGLQPDDTPPQHFELVEFQSMLVSRSIATDVAGEFDRQARELSEIFDQLPDEIIRGLYGLDTEKISGGTQSLYKAGENEPEWRRLETRLLDFWTASHSQGRIPSSDQIKIGDLMDISDYLTLVRVVPDTGFTYEIVGKDVERANQGPLLGATINAKARSNNDKHGEPGLQAELSELFQRSVDQRRPETLATYYLNAEFNKCHLLTIQVPVLAADGGDDIDFLLGIALIRRLTVS